MLMVIALIAVRLSCQLEAAVIQSKEDCRVGWSWIELVELNSECVRKLKVIGTYFRT